MGCELRATDKRGVDEVFSSFLRQAAACETLFYQAVGSSPATQGMKCLPAEQSTMPRAADNILGKRRVSVCQPSVPPARAIEERLAVQRLLADGHCRSGQEMPVTGIDNSFLQRFNSAVSFIPEHKTRRVAKAYMLQMTLSLTQ